MGYARPAALLEQEPSWAASPELVVVYLACTLDVGATGLGVDEAVAAEEVFTAGGWRRVQLLVELARRATRW
jgi:hypothetical protein